MLGDEGSRRGEWGRLWERGKRGRARWEETKGGGVKKTIVDRRGEREG